MHRQPKAGDNAQVPHLIARDTGDTVSSPVRGKFFRVNAACWGRQTNSDITKAHHENVFRTRSRDALHHGVRARAMESFTTHPTPTKAKLDGPILINEIANIRPTASASMEDPIQYVGKFEHELTQLIHDYGDYLFMVFALACFVAIAWLLFRKRRSPPPELASARTRAIVGIMLASPGISSDADGGGTRLIMGDNPTRRVNALNSDRSANA